MTCARQCHREAGGFSLVELLIAMALGVMLIGGATTVFRGNLRSAELGQAVAAMQAGGRYALDEIARDLRAAGHRGCTSAGGVGSAGSAPLGVTTPDAPLDSADAAASAVFGARIEADGWKPARPPGYVPPLGVAAPVVGTDALLVQYALTPGEPLQGDMDDRDGPLRIAGVVSELEVDDLAIVADCTGADLFRIATRTGSVGNIELTPDRALERRYAIDPVFPLGSPRVMPFVSAIYYIGDTGRLGRAGDAVSSLYVQTFPYTVANPPLELVEGVEQLQLSFGIRDADGDLRFVDALDADYDPVQVTSVRVGLLVASLDRLDDLGTPRGFRLAGREVVPAGQTAGAGAISFPDDGRIRMAFQRSVTIRNRALSEPAS